jgi:hypothetical protein
MELLLGFVVFDLILYFLLRLLPGPNKQPKVHNPLEEKIEARPFGPRLGNTFPSQQFAQRMPWPRTRVRPQDLPPRW